MECLNHPNKEVKGACVGCGNFFCEDCLTQIHGKNYCKNCLVELAEKKDIVKVVARPVQPQPQPQPQIIIQQPQQQVEKNTAADTAFWCICIIVILLMLAAFIMSYYSSY